MICKAGWLSYGIYTFLTFLMYGLKLWLYDFNCLWSIRLKSFDYALSLHCMPIETQNECSMECSEDGSQRKSYGFKKYGFMTISVKFLKKVSWYLYLISPGRFVQPNWLMIRPGRFLEPRNLLLFDMLWFTWRDWNIYAFIQFSCFRSNKFLNW